MQFNNRLLLKILELAIAIVCIVLYESNGGFSTNPLIVCSTIGGFTIICGVLLVGHILNSIVEKRLNALLSIIGCVLFVISGALVIDRWHDASDLLFKETKRNALAAGSLMIINGAVFLMDTISICRTRAEIPVIREAIAIVCIVLWESTTGGLQTNPLIVCSAIGGYTIICGVLLVGHIMDSLVEKRLNAILSIIGCVLFVISGALVIDQWHDRSDLLFKESKRNALAAGSLMIINGAVFLMDTISICRTRAQIPVIHEVNKNHMEINRY